MRKLIDVYDGLNDLDLFTDRDRKDISYSAPPPKKDSTKPAEPSKKTPPAEVNLPHYRIPAKPEVKSGK